jgi:hypothetical protein
MDRDGLIRGARGCDLEVRAAIEALWRHLDPALCLG